MSRFELGPRSFVSTADSIDGRVALATPVGDVDFAPDSADGDGFLFRSGAKAPSGYLYAERDATATGALTRSYILFTADKRREIGRYPNQFEAVVALFGPKEHA